MKLAFFLVVLVGAPFQCASDPDPEHRLEDSPSEALWDLAARLEREGHDDARRSTLEQIIERYPGSREAQRARDELGIAASTPDESEDVSEAPSHEVDPQEANENPSP